MVLLASVLATIFYTKEWLHLVMFPLLLFVGEMEYAMLREKFEERETTLAKFDRRLNSRRSFRRPPPSFAIALRRR